MLPRYFFAQNIKNFAELLLVLAFFQRPSPYTPSMCVGYGLCQNHSMYTKYCMPHFADSRPCRANFGHSAKSFPRPSVPMLTGICAFALLLKNCLNIGKNRSLQGPGLDALSEKNCWPFSVLWQCKLCVCMFLAFCSVSHSNFLQPSCY